MKLGCTSALALKRSGAGCDADAEATSGGDAVMRPEDGGGAATVLAPERAADTGAIAIALEFSGGSDAAGTVALKGAASPDV
jgi:hypothetical protein